MAKKIKKIQIKKEKHIKRREVASILTYIVIILLLFQGIYAIILKDKLVQEIDTVTQQQLIDAGITLSDVSSFFLILSIIWIVFGVGIFFVKKGIEKGKIQWWWFLIISILTFFTGRVECSVMGIIASILYAKK